MSRHDIWDATYVAKNSEELSCAYDKWACDYDRDTLHGMGYVGPALACKVLDSYLESPKSRVLDAGCGTGLVGEKLAEMGYDRLEALDYCDSMLEQAKAKDVYGHLVQGDMNESLKFADNSYDATICVGTFTYAHVGPHAFEEFIRITKPNGYICFTVRDGAYQEYDYRSKMVELESNGTWELLQMLDEDYLIKEKVTAKFCIYKVLGGQA
ncbi:class I SAM-dependent DNA methyltransferase [Desulfovibrio inopinatus]|uniref:class I SAM-dependent DNA methyltransferase n=1 Tax=Desulfovibrio inopinatus TaxID=102109 RepID=UPI000425E024|nr:class I SAM-dependent methyltransferase [Desulfovibrio inopinatus]